jgi:hypothetical protein
MKTREIIYDDLIAPLMAEVHWLCKIHRIDYITVFELDLGLRSTCGLVSGDSDETLQLIVGLLAERRERGK